MKTIWKVTKVHFFFSDLHALSCANCASNGRSLSPSNWSSFGRHLWYLSSHYIPFHRLLSVLPQCLLLPQRIPRCRPTLVLWGELCDLHQMMTWLVVYLPLWKILVSWGYCSQYMEKWKMFQTTNQWQMHPEKNRPLWVVHHLRAVQGDISLPGTHVAPRGPGHAKEHWMAKVAPAFNFGWGKVDDILNHCFNPIPIGRPDKSAQGWHAWFDGGCPWLTMEA